MSSMVQVKSDNKIIKGKKIALFGGSFNPIHYGHLSLAESAYTEFNLAKIIFIPAGIPPHKTDIPFAPKIHRLNLIKLAIKGNGHFSVSDYEIRKKGVSYTCDTIEYFKTDYPNIKIIYLIGEDLLREIHTWKKGEEILDLCPFIAGLRPNPRTQKIPSRLRRKITLFESPLMDISSTFIRKRVKQHRSIRYLVPDNIINYIFKKRLYLT
jgi:nicotinate-nucleotide adenylyltransferase